MKIILVKLLISAFALFTLVSCERDVDNVRYPEFRQKLVISAFISPNNTSNSISVTSNRRIYGDLTITETLGNLIATLSDDSHEISLDTTRTGFVLRSSDLHVEEGKIYKLKVRSDKGLFAEATCTVPLKRSFALEVDTFRTFEQISEDYVYASFMSNFYFIDIQGENNYYRFYCEQIIYHSSYYYPQFAVRFLDFENKYFTDKGKDGDRSLITTLNINDPKYDDSSFLKIYLLNTDKAYYDFHKSLENYEGGDNPFTEGSPIYSNITGGLGIFAAYTVDSLVFRLK
jgi:hypothetical protein